MTRILRWPGFRKEYLAVDGGDYLLQLSNPPLDKWSRDGSVFWKPTVIQSIAFSQAQRLVHALR